MLGPCVLTLAAGTSLVHIISCQQGRACTEPEEICTSSQEYLSLLQPWNRPSCLSMKCLYSSDLSPLLPRGRCVSNGLYVLYHQSHWNKAATAAPDAYKGCFVLPHCQCRLLLACLEKLLQMEVNADISLPVGVKY